MTAAPVGSATAQLALLEGRRLARHPLFLTGLVFAAGGCAAFLSRRSVGHPGWDAYGWTVYAGFVLLAPLTMVATNMVTLRDRRAHTVEQHEALPLGVRARVGATLTAILAPTAVAVTALAVVAAYAASRFHLDRSDVLVLASLPLILTTLAALGVALARWMPNPFVAPAVAIALYLWTPGNDPSAWRTLMPLNAADGIGLAALRLPYLLGLTLLFAGAALTQPQRSRTGVLLAVAGAALVTAAAVGILR